MHETSDRKIILATERNDTSHELRGHFNRDTYLKTVERALERAETKEKIIAVIRDAIRGQAGRKDLEELFASIRFTSDKSDEERFITTDRYITMELDEIEESLADPDTRAEFDRMSFDEFKNETREEVGSLVAPELKDAGAPELTRVLKYVGERLIVPDYNVSELIGFINDYCTIAPGREVIVDRCVFGADPKEKNNLFSARSDLKEILEDPETCEKIDIIISSNLIERFTFSAGLSHSTDKSDSDMRLFLNAVLIESLKLAAHNEYLTITSKDRIYAHAVNRITEKRLADIHAFDSTLTTIDLDNLRDFQILEGLPEAGRAFCKKIYEATGLAGTGAFNRIGISYFSDALADPEKFRKLELAYDLGAISGFTSSYEGDLTKRIFTWSDEQIKSVAMGFKTGLVKGPSDGRAIARILTLNTDDLLSLNEAGETLLVGNELLNALRASSPEDRAEYKSILASIEGNQWVKEEKKMELLRYAEELRTLTPDARAFLDAWHAHQGQFYSSQVEAYTEPLKKASLYPDVLARMADRYRDLDNQKLMFNLLSDGYMDLIDIDRELSAFARDPNAYLLKFPRPSDVFDHFREFEDIMNRRNQPMRDDVHKTIFFSTFVAQATTRISNNVDFPYTTDERHVSELAGRLASWYASAYDAQEILSTIVHMHDDLADVTSVLERITDDPDSFFKQRPQDVMKNYDAIAAELASRGKRLHQTTLDVAFENTLRMNPALLMRETEFPFTSEQQTIADLFQRIHKSPSHEIKNMDVEIAEQIARNGDLSTYEDRYRVIEEIFVKNNLPFVGKQEKVCEVLHPEIETRENSSPVLQSLHGTNARRLLVFKDLMRASVQSLNMNLEQYLLVLKNGATVLDRFESGATLDDDETEQLKYFFRKINALTENTRLNANATTFDPDRTSLAENLAALRKNFGVRKGETITDKFTRTFLRRIDINSIDDALRQFINLRSVADTRNREFASSGKIILSPTDLAKGVDSAFFDTFLDRGVYSPEFIGAETEVAKAKAKRTDMTPWDTDVITVGDRDARVIVEDSTASAYGDVIIIVRDRGQFDHTKVGQPLPADSGKMELFRTGGTNSDHFGIRTGFGSTEISALLVKDKIATDDRALSEIKFSIAKKGFYIPVCDKSGRVLFSSNEFETYRAIFRGIDRYHGDPIAVDETWRESLFREDIESVAQTEGNLEKLQVLRAGLYADLAHDLKGNGITLHQERYDDSVVGARIVDTGSTGRGAALDEGYDFDFVVKLDDVDFNKVPAITNTLESKYPLNTSYERNGMHTFRFKNFERDGETISLDISFIKKSDSEELDANEAVTQKYNSIRNKSGEKAWLDTLTNVRFAKRELKRAECYKKGMAGVGEQQGGLGGIGVENWILKYGGNAIKAFRDFHDHAYREGTLVPFAEFKQTYHVFSAGENVRGGVRAEDFVAHMDETGYRKMAELSRKFVLSEADLL